jgi:DNA polymerase III delta subunit
MIEESRIPQDEVAKALGIHPFFAASFFANLKKHSLSKLKNSLKAALRADMSLKGVTPEGIVLEKFILFMCK